MFCCRRRHAPSAASSKTEPATSTASHAALNLLMKRNILVHFSKEGWGIWSVEPTVYFSLNIYLELSLWSTFSFSHRFSSWYCLSFMPQCRHFGTLPCQQETQFQAIQVGKEASSTELSFTSLLWKRQRQWKKKSFSHGTFNWYLKHQPW